MSRSSFQLLRVSYFVIMQSVLSPDRMIRIYNLNLQM